MKQLGMKIAFQGGEGVAVLQNLMAVIEPAAPDLKRSFLAASEQTAD